MLTALATIGFEGLVKKQRARSKKSLAGEDLLVASGMGYIDCALANPALFRLIFASKRPDFTDPALTSARQSACNPMKEVLQIAADATRLMQKTMLF